MFSYVYKDLDVAHKFDECPEMIPDYTKHYHDFYEIYIFVRGNVLYTVEDEKMRLQKNSIIFIQPGDHHFVAFEDDSPYERYVIKFHEHLVPYFLKDFFIKRSAFYFSANENLSELYNKIDSFYENYNMLELQLLYSGIVTEMLIKLYHSEYHEKEINPNDTITAIIQYINENIRLPLTLNDLCSKFHFSPTVLYKEFHTHLKIPIMKYVRSKKIIAAYQLILRGEKPIKVAESFGYSDYTTFYRSFVSVMGFAPSHPHKDSR